jgi:hypothetical protein
MTFLVSLIVIRQYRCHLAFTVSVFTVLRNWYLTPALRLDLCFSLYHLCQNGFFLFSNLPNFNLGPHLSLYRPWLLRLCP